MTDGQRDGTISGICLVNFPLCPIKLTLAAMYGHFQWLTTSTAHEYCSLLGDGKPHTKFWLECITRVITFFLIEHVEGLHQIVVDAFHDSHARLPLLLK